MFNKDNIKFLEDNGYDYIVGSRIRNLTKSAKAVLLDTDTYVELTEDLKTKEIELEGRKLVVSHSMKRSHKDKYDRDEAVKKLSKKLESSSKPESLISNYGYKKDLNIKGDSEITLNESKLAEAEMNQRRSNIVFHLKLAKMPKKIPYYGCSY